MELDHVFVLTDNPGRAAARLAEAGLAETYRRRHLGQGTTNVCYGFDDAFLEILWIEDGEEAASPEIARTRLFERSLWRANGTCPIGIAWREAADAVPPFAVWPYRPPYLPPGASIPVAVESDDPAGPMMFRSPGSAVPAAWPAERRGELQRAAGLAGIERVVVTCPAAFEAGPTLAHLGRAIGIDLERGNAPGWGLSLRVQRKGGGVVEIPVLGEGADAPVGRS